VSETMSEQVAPETPVTAPEADAPRSPSEAINLVESYSRTAQEITGEIEAPDFDNLQLSDDLIGDEYPADYSEQQSWEPQPGEAAYEPWARAEIDRLQDAQVRLVIEAGQRLGVDPLQLAQSIGAERAQQEAAARQYAATAENFALEHIDGLSEQWDAEYVHRDEALSIARETFAEVARRHGPEVAASLSQEILDAAVRGAAQQFEQVAEYGRRLAEQHAAHLGTAAPDPVEVLRHTEEAFPRQLREHGGDEDAALEAAFDLGVRKAGGEPTSPRQIAELYSRRGRRIEEAQRVRQASAPPQPEPPPRSTKQIVDHYAAEARRLAKETR
jgi:hypothetical protein